MMDDIPADVAGKDLSPPDLDALSFPESSCDGMSLSSSGNDEFRVAKPVSTGPDSGQTQGSSEGSGAFEQLLRDRYTGSQSSPVSLTKCRKLSCSLSQSPSIVPLSRARLLCSSVDTKPCADWSSTQTRFRWCSGTLAMLPAPSDCSMASSGSSMHGARRIIEQNKLDFSIGIECLLGRSVDRESRSSGASSAAFTTSTVAPTQVRCYDQLLAPRSFCLVFLLSIFGAHPPL